jgi:hypothetical protein
MRNHSFKFMDEKLNRRLIHLLTKSTIQFSVDAHGLIRYSDWDAEAVENQLIKSIRDRAFRKPWQILCCPEQWVARYRAYMDTHRVPFIVEQSDGELCFVLPRNYRPHSWKLEADPAREERRVATG